MVYSERIGANVELVTHKNLSEKRSIACEAAARIRKIQNMQVSASKDSSGEWNIRQVRQHD